MSPTVLTDRGRDTLLDDIRASLGERTDVSAEDLLARLRARASRIESGPFSEIVRRARTDFLRLNEKEAQAFAAMLGEAYKDTVSWYERRMASSKGFEYRELHAMREDIASIFREFAQEYRKEIGTAMVGSANVATERMKSISAIYADKLPDDIAPIAKRTMLSLSTRGSRQAVDALWSRVAANDGLKLSDRIWNLQKYGSRQVGDLVGRALVSGKSATMLAKELEPYLLPGQRGPTWTTRGTRAKVLRSASGELYTRGTVSYNALRLARTEMFLAQKESHARNVILLREQGMSYVVGIRWALSSGHVGPDVCDLWAAQSSTGLPPGVYHPEDLPDGHPNCWCYTLDVLDTPQVFAEKMAAIGPGTFERIAEVAAASGFTPIVRSQASVVGGVGDDPGEAPDPDEPFDWKPATTRTGAARWAEEHLAARASYDHVDLDVANAVNRRLAENMHDLGLGQLDRIRATRGTKYVAYANGSQFGISGPNAKTIAILEERNAWSRTKFANGRVAAKAEIAEMAKLIKAGRDVGRFMQARGEALTWDDLLGTLRSGALKDSESLLLSYAKRTTTIGAFDAADRQIVRDWLRRGRVEVAAKVRALERVRRMRGFTYTIPGRSIENLVDHETGHILFFQLARTDGGRAIIDKYRVTSWAVHGRDGRMQKWAAGISEYAYYGYHRSYRYHELVAEMFAVWRQGEDLHLLPRAAKRFFAEAVAYMRAR